MHDAQFKVQYAQQNIPKPRHVASQKFCTKMDSMPKKLLVYSLTPSRSLDNFDNKSLILSCKNVLFVTYNTAKNIVIMSRFDAAKPGGM